MKYALVNPPWTFEGSIYFGCREPHLPLEYGYAAARLEAAGHEAILLDAQLEGWSMDETRARVTEVSPDVIVMTTAPSYLFWRCPPAELRVPQALLEALGDLPGVRVVVGPHASTTPRTTLRKLGGDVAVLGEPEEVLPRLAMPRDRWKDIPSIAWRDGDAVRVQGGPHASEMAALPALRWPPPVLARHRHHHHRFDTTPAGPGAEMEASRGCPYRCMFCAKEAFRNRYRRRPLPVILDELDGLVAAGVEYVYFVDEIFLPDRALLEALTDRPIRFGVQTRVDLWTRPMLDLLGQAGCVSIEAGVESISEHGRNLLDKQSRLTTQEMSDRLVHARRLVPFVQANLLDARVDAPEAVEAWREHLLAHGVWANDPVPLFPYPGSPGYARRWGDPDDDAWERAVDDYLERFDAFSDIQDVRPRRLADLESPAPPATSRR
jgi:anaerobic magnesium-protoporphyrin IX monomethyl ester cyclase